MNKLSTVLAILISSCLNAQFKFAPNVEDPFGLPNPEAPAELSDYQELIGLSKCESISRGSGNDWGEPVEMIGSLSIS